MSVSYSLLMAWRLNEGTSLGDLQALPSNIPFCVQQFSFPLSPQPHSIRSFASGVRMEGEASVNHPKSQTSPSSSMVPKACQALHASKAVSKWSLYLECTTPRVLEAQEGSRWYTMYWQGLFYIDLDVRTGPWRHQQACVSNMINMVFYARKDFSGENPGCLSNVKRWIQQSICYNFIFLWHVHACVCARAHKHTYTHRVRGELALTIYLWFCNSQRESAVPKEVPHEWGDGSAGTGDL